MLKFEKWKTDNFELQKLDLGPWLKIKKAYFIQWHLLFLSEMFLKSNNFRYFSELTD
jgi:hypothetical protein